MERLKAAELRRGHLGHLPLKRAVLCLDCESISDANQECPACCSSALMNLSTVLNPQGRIQLPAMAA